MIKLPFDIELMNGRGVPTVFHVRRAGAEDVDHVMKLQQTIVSSPNPNRKAPANLSGTERYTVPASPMKIPASTALIKTRIWVILSLLFRFHSMVI